MFPDVSCVCVVVWYSFLSSPPDTKKWSHRLLSRLHRAFRGGSQSPSLTKQEMISSGKRWRSWLSVSNKDISNTSGQDGLTLVGRNLSHHDSFDFRSHSKHTRGWWDHHRPKHPVPQYPVLRILLAKTQRQVWLWDWVLIYFSVCLLPVSSLTVFTNRCRKVLYGGLKLPIWTKKKKRSLNELTNELICH